MNLLHRPDIWFFDIWHLFGNLTSFWQLDNYLNLNHLSPSHGYFCTLSQSQLNFQLLYVLSVWWTLWTMPKIAFVHFGHGWVLPLCYYSVNPLHWVVTSVFFKRFLSAVFRSFSKNSVLKLIICVLHQCKHLPECWLQFLADTGGWCCHAPPTFRVPTHTGKPGKNERSFSSHGKVREF